MRNVEYVVLTGVGGVASWAGVEACRRAWRDGRPAVRQLSKSLGQHRTKREERERAFVEQIVKASSRPPKERIEMLHDLGLVTITEVESHDDFARATLSDGGSIDYYRSHDKYRQACDEQRRRFEAGRIQWGKSPFVGAVIDPTDD